MSFLSKTIERDIDHWLQEDGLGQSSSYWEKLPLTPTQCQLKIKSPLVLAGMPWFTAIFEKLDPALSGQLSNLTKLEGQHFKGNEVIELPVPMKWAAAVTGERLALNLLHRASSVATATSKLVEKTSELGIKVLDTRKTTPGLRELEKYAVTVGGGYNHRFSQVDAWMVKDNHKTLMGLKAAVEFFRSLNQPYKNIIVEIHSLAELTEAREVGVRHFMLDNFSIENLQQACKTKRDGEFFEVSGGINLDTVHKVCIPGVDAVSSGAITMFPSAVDISFKYQAVKL